MGACAEGSCTESGYSTRRRAIRPVGLSLLVCVLTSQFNSIQVKSSQVKSSQVKSSQVSPNARKRAQCKGGSGKEKNIYTKKCETLYNLRASLTNFEKIPTWNKNPGNTAKEIPIGRISRNNFPITQSRVPAFGR